jgi:carbonic anhydrase
LALRVLSDLFARNRTWAAEMTRQDPEFFARLARQQVPQHLGIGCSDSRVPANQIGAQVQNVSQTTVVREAWARGQPLALHGWIYDVADGLLGDLGMCLTGHV